MGYKRDRPSALADRALVDAHYAAGRTVTVCKPGARALNYGVKQWDSLARGEVEPAGEPPQAEAA